MNLGMFRPVCAKCGRDIDEFIVTRYRLGEIVEFIARCHGEEIKSEVSWVIGERPERINRVFDEPE